MPDPDAGGAAPSPPRWAPVSLASVVSADTATQLPLVAPIDPYIGRIIGGKYRILDRLGAGGMAVVYRAQEQGMLTREVAIKVLTPESALSQATISPVMTVPSAAQRNQNSAADLDRRLGEARCEQVADQDLAGGGGGHGDRSPELPVPAAQCSPLGDVGDRG